ncbi:LOW QUALITY PROTEIN: centrosomal protein of 164 kDa-like [Liolophura sinensis]|uniref:LOW QUALITY PROTEIN: centrosomal protein of 164 kDa-like n=1 Tax=Liolophura sinensis TaxID=3198878 RepID=UPI003158E921
MMINEQLILEEDYDENYQPTEDEILEYARSFGIDAAKEQSLLWIAREGINAPLPEHWKPCQDPNGDIYYFNFATGDSIWDHPCDEFYRKMVQEERKKGSSLAGKAKKGKNGGGRKGKDDKAEGKGVGGLGVSGLSPLRAEPSPGVPAMHKSGLQTMGSLKSSSGLAPLRGSAGASQMRSSFNSTTGSVKSMANPQQSMNMTSSVSIPVYSTDYEQEAVKTEDSRPHMNLEQDLQDVANLGYEESDPPSGKESASESDSEDYDKDVDFGIDKNLSERIMDIELLEPQLRGSLEKDVDGTLSMKSTARGDDSQAGKLSPLILEQRVEDERKKKAELAAMAAERRRSQDKTQEKAEQEEHLRSANDRALQEMKEKLEEELEKAKKELLEDKEMKMRRLKEEMMKAQDDEEKKILQDKEEKLRSLRAQVREDTDAECELLTQGKSDTLQSLREELEAEKVQKEASIRKEMDTSLQKLRDEVNSLQKEEISRLSEEKNKALAKIQKQVEEAVCVERRKLEEEHKAELESLKQKYRIEQESSQEELEALHRKQLNSLQTDLSHRHEKELAALREELEKIHLQNELALKQEIEAARNQPSAVSVLDEGLEDVLNERRQEIKEEQRKELSRLREEHERQIDRLKQQYIAKEKKEKLLLEEKFKAECRKIQGQHEKELDDLKRTLQSKKESVLDQYEEDEEELRGKSAELERRKTEVEKSIKQLEEQERKLGERIDNFHKEEENFDKEQEEGFGSHSVNLSSKELERMREERKQLKEELRTEQSVLDTVKAEKKSLEKEVFKLRSEMEQNSRKLSGLRGKIDQKQQEYSSIQQKIILASDETQKLAEEQLRGEKLCVEDLEKTPTPILRPTSAELPSESIDGGDISRAPSHKVTTLRGQEIFGKRSRRKVSYDLSEDTTTFSVPIVRHMGSSYSVLQAHLSRETNSISLAKEFLRKQRNSLKRRQAGLQAARDELGKDILKQQQGTLSPSAAELLSNVRDSLEREAVELDKMAVHMNAGNRLVREKEVKIQQLRSQLGQESGSESESELVPFEHPHQPVQLPRFDLSDDDESSGVSSTDLNIDNFLTGLPGELKYPTDPVITKPRSQGKLTDTDPLAESLLKINTELSRVLGMINTKNAVVTPTQVTPGDDGPSLSLGTRYNDALIPHPPYHASSSAYSVWNPARNPYLSGPGYRVNFGGLVQTAEESLEKKWRKYFGAQNPPLTESVAQPKLSGIHWGHTPVRDQLRRFRLSLQTKSRLGSTQDRLTEHREWFRKFQQEVSFGASYARTEKGESTAINPTFNLNSLSLRSLDNPEPVSSSTPAQPPSGLVRLELDENNEIRVRQY